MPHPVPPSPRHRVNPRTKFKYLITGKWRLIAIAVCLFLILLGKGQATPLPPLQTHPLPPQLAQWEDSSNSGDYFDRVQPTSVGYLVWSEFPIKVYIERPTNPRDRRFQAWVNDVQTAVAEWNDYLPLTLVEQPEQADILWERVRPPLRATLNRETRQFEIPIARNAEANYKVYRRPGTPPHLAHRFTIQLSPSQTDEDTLATARHELGHALGIWGHSPLKTDALYPTQVRYPPPISARDINTLKKIYQQPTRLGWAIESDIQSRLFPR
ncbi:peptidase [Lusitaniella coriacea]|uniref:peptidase n=1 Tax=Lusitaniella coriacea TaxID=1983105 RepID=UPI003CF5AB93